MVYLYIFYFVASFVFKMPTFLGCFNRIQEKTSPPPLGKEERWTQGLARWQWDWRPLLLRYSELEVLLQTWGKGDGSLMFILVRGAISSYLKTNKQNTCLKDLKESWKNPRCLSHCWVSQRKFHTGENLLDFLELGSSPTVYALLVWQVWWSVTCNHQCLPSTEK